MSKSRSFSIYLLKQDFNASNALKDDHKLDEETEVKNLPDSASLFVLDNEPRTPWWVGYFDIQKKLFQVGKGALIFLPVGGRCFALSFGHVSHNLKDESYEYDFGLRVTLNSVDPTKLKSTDTLEPGMARRQRTQVSVVSDLTFFDFERDSAVLKNLTGKVKDEYKDLFKQATGSKNLRINSSLSPGELIQLCGTLLDLYKSVEYKNTFPGIQNIAPVVDPQTIMELNEKLLDALCEKSEDLYLAIPDIVDYTDNTCAVFSGAGGSNIYDEVFLDHYYEYLESHGVEPGNIDITKLRTSHKLWLTDEDGERRKSYSLFKCFIYSTSLGAGGKETYHLNEGDWYRVDNDYVAELKTYLDKSCEDLGLPDFDHGKEGDYNEAVANNDPKFLCLDGKNISLPGQTQIEPCDLYSVGDGHAVFYHIKISTFSAKLSHLFNQGVSAIELLKLEDRSVEKLKSIIDGIALEAEKNEFKQPLGEGKFRVVYGIITHKSKEAKSENLPLFSRISLRREMKYMRMMGVDACYGFIANNLPPKSRKKERKSRKK